MARKTLITFLICTGIIFNSKSQNLISNPSFENTFGNCGAVSSWDIYFNDNVDSIPSYFKNECLLKDWMTMTETPDVYSFSSYTYNLPTSNLYCKNLYPHYGNNIVGSGLFTKYDSIGFYLNAREVIENRLIDTLKNGHKYKLSFYTQLFDSMPISSLGWGKILASNSFSVYFSNTVLNWQSNTPFHFGVYQPQIQIDTIITDTQHWVLLSDTFTAKGGERYMAVGNFKPDSLTQSKLVDSVRAGSGFSYYFYDDFSLIDLTPDGVEEVGKWNQLTVYPNPASKSIVVSCKSPESNREVNTIEVTDVLGRIQMFQQAHHDGDVLAVDSPLERGLGGFEINVEALPSGIYFIKATDTKGNVLNGKFVKE